ncbi:hypothetical protein OGAPHI_000822 [Ogataea philodendri]|uniref:SYO1-like TPR repeats domain-containing protein n=1 Tax=Ogataea philodendri TaxID=1378263 RepID=A0A9P8PFS0_9ASCO|nr:uncharacterized protein OGAPHI_000822 [Ogataea philodendri]KAH3671111.1 hypothetical protein OGAPHI_000822 [Ogataea philodendri]
MAKLKKRSRSAKLAGQRKQNVPQDDKDFQKIAPLLDKLKSDATNDRSMAVGAINTLCDTDPEIRKLFLKSDLIRTILTKLVHDSSDEVVVESFGLLRNLIIEEGYDLSVFLWRSDIWTVLEHSFSKAKNSLDHIKDEKVSGEQRRLLFDFIENIIACLGSLSLEISTEVFHSDIFPKMVASGIPKFVITLIEKNLSKSLTLTSLEFLYDLSTISTPFIEAFSQDDSVKQIFGSLNVSNDLSKVYLLGLHFQTLEFSNGLDDDQTVQIADSLLNITNKLVDTAPEEKESLKAFELTLDIFATIVEIKSETELQSTKLAAVFESQVVPFLAKVFQYASVKVLVCLTNILYFYRGEVPQSCSDVVQTIRPAVLQQLSQKLEERDLEAVNLYLGYVEVSEDLQATEELRLVGDALVKLALQLDKITPASTELTNHVMRILTALGKTSQDLDFVTNITKLIVDKNFVEPIKYYNSTRLGELRKKHQYLLEDVLVGAVNCIIDLYDDDYFYNKPLYHEGGLGDVLKSHLADYKKIYKAIDKNSQPQLKQVSEETLQNLERFVRYKDGEL